MYMELIIEYKWILLITLEVFAWAATFFMFYARYKIQSRLWFQVASVIFALTGVIPQVLLGIVNYVITKELDLFTLVILLLVVYGFTIGKQQVKKLDAWAQRKFSRKRGED